MSKRKGYFGGHLGKVKISIIALLVAGCIIGTHYLYQCFQYRDITEEERAELIRQTLKIALIDKEIPDAQNHIKDSQDIILSTIGMDPDLDLAFPGVHLILLTPDAIQKRADQQGYLTFFQLEDVESTCSGVRISLDTHDTIRNDSTNGITLEFYKQMDGSWQVRDWRRIWMY